MCKSIIPDIIGDADLEKKAENFLQNQTSNSLFLDTLFVLLERKA